jgi:prepilin-type processing-associated H-X9-DG protein
MYHPNRYKGIGIPEPMWQCPADSRTLQIQTITEPGFSPLPIQFTAYLGVNGISHRDSAVNPAGAPQNRANWGVMVPVAVTMPNQPAIGSRVGDITDGTSLTLMVGERPPSANLDFGWGFAGYGASGNADADVIMGVNEVNDQSSGLSDTDSCPQGPYQYQQGNINNPCDQFHFWSMHTGGANWLLADGSSKFIPYGINNTVMRALATRAGGEVVGDY